MDQWGAVNVQNCAKFDDEFEAYELYSEITFYLKTIEEE